MKEYKKLLLSNKAWASERLEVDAHYFDDLSKDQNPLFLWIGCADSRVPAEEITHADPGEIFVHRNVANMVVHTDMNLLSVLQYAVEVLKIKHIIICGHYNCGGVKAAMTNKDFGLINKWLRNIKEVYEKHYDELHAIENEQSRFNAMVELNVKEQIQNLAKTSIVQKAWKNSQLPHLHGWVFDIHKGEIKEVVNISAGEWESPVFKYEFE
ncbi:MAG: carbonic anhydrase [Cytophagales bacterium]|jgi:carbonic anhydrase|nr:carbonic anhydrase [Cytophagales bacterium]